MGSRGFSLIELMVTIAVLAILLAIGLPSFQGSMRSNQVATGANELLASLSLARAEAIRNPMGAGICSSLDGESCGGTWGDGWLVWVESERDGTLGEDERVVRYVEASDRLSIEEQDMGAGGTAGTVVFDSRGLAGGHARTIVIQSATCPSGHELVREVAVSSMGQARIERKACE